MSWDWWYIRPVSCDSTSIDFLLILVLTTDLVLTVGEGLLSTDVPAGPIFWVKGSEVDIIAQLGG